MTLTPEALPIRGSASAPAVTLEPRPERRLIPHQPSYRTVDFQIQVAMPPSEAQASRTPITLALVIDRSGSMSGDKIVTAKRAAQAVLDRLDERDTAAVVVFDDQIDTLQSAASVTPEIKTAVRAALAKTHARGSTALHEGWLTGCQAITAAAEGAGQQGVARCFLLTDGLANVGVQEPERIATDAAGIRRNTGIGTSTFGVGLDYAEELLGPMAEAGGGSFHHLRTASEIANTFIGELGELLATAAANARLELEVESGVSVDIVSLYAASHDADNPMRWTVSLGDLISGEDRHVMLRFGFGDAPRREDQAVRARLVWTAAGAERHTDWATLRFTYASDAECVAESPDERVIHQAGEGMSDRVQRDALLMSKRGDLAGANLALVEARQALSAFRSDDPSLQTELDAIERLSAELAHGPLASAPSKEAYFMRQARSRGKRDLRGDS